MGIKTVLAPIYGRPFRSVRIAVLSGLTLLGAWFAWETPVAIQIAREAVWDRFVAAKPRAYDPALGVVVVDIDEDSLAAYGQFPWPRSRQARLVRALADQGARAVAFDFIFPEPDRTSLGNVFKALGEDIAGYRQPLGAEALAAQPDNDRLFAEAMARVPTVLGFSVDAREGGKNLPRKWPRIDFENRRDQRYLIRYPGAVASLPVLQSAAAGNGGLAMVTDTDGVLRRVPLLIKAGRRTAPALATEVLRVALGVKLAAASGAAGLESVSFGDIRVPTDAHGRMRLYDSGPRAERYVSAKAVLDGSLPDGRLANAVVFIGTSAEGLKDIRSTPLTIAGPGVAVHAQAAEQILSGTFLKRPDWAWAAEAGTIGGVGLLLVLLALRPVRRLPPWSMAVAGSGGLLLAGWAAFDGSGLLIDPLLPGGTLIIAGLTEQLILLAEVRRERSRIRNAFSRYLSPDVVARVSDDPSQLRLGGDRRNLTVMFSDIRGFTALSQQFTERPEELTHLINRLLTPLTEVVMRHGGTVDKYMGDCVMAFWNAPLDVPDHAAAACAAALDMRTALKQVNRELAAEMTGETFAAGLDIGIGINSGTCFVGNMGSEQRLDYSVIGDTVNLASRLEGQCKTYHVGLVLGGDTAALLDGTHSLFELDRVVVKGRQDPTPVYTLLDPADGPHDALVARQAAFLAAYRARDWDGANGLLAEIVAMPEAGRAGLAAYLDSMAERIAALRLDPPPEDWDGRYIATGK